MDADALWNLANTAVLPFWALLLVAPRWRWTQTLVHSALVPGVLGITYTIVILTGMASDPDPTAGLPFGSLAWALAAFSVPMTLVGGWIHYLVFDLFVAAWAVRDAGRHDIPHAYVVPCLVLTLMLGPLGLLCYLLVRFALRRRFSLIETT